MNARDRRIKWLKGMIAQQTRLYGVPKAKHVAELQALEKDQ